MASPNDNHLLATLLPHDLDSLRDHFRTVELHTGDTLARAGDEIRTLYFPHSGIVSFMVEVADGRVVQTSMVGRDGVIGAAQAIDGKVSLNKIVVQMPGTASAIDRDHVREGLGAGHAIRKLFAAYEQFFVADIQQTAVCNALHTVEQRACRWLLRMLDLAGTDLQLTHDQLAEMIGVTRPSVSQELGHLQSSGHISYRRGVIQITNVEGLKHSACECYESVRRNYRRVVGPIPPSHA